ncbi:MAG TPA: choice-of-anchor P family protein [Acidobacteriaceae bacterium]|jgi:hypothetical protein|nr:choice-of-anchor P family protein [Acidobacteriaceae bacterium]
MSETYPFYHAEASALEGRLNRPVTEVIYPQAPLSLPREGGYRSARVGNFRVQEVLSFSSAYTQVAGTPSLKANHGQTTLATAVLENFNVLDVVTADRIVAQIGTDYVNQSYIPSVTFLGTRFENLRIAGHPVHLELDIDFLGENGHNARWSENRALRERIGGQRQAIESQNRVPPEYLESYNQLPSKEGTLGSLGCSLVNRTEGSFPVRCFGHVIDVPHFGRIYLAVLRIRESDLDQESRLPLQTEISLTMIRIQMGCIGDGSASGGNLIVNGGGKGTG